MKEDKLLVDREIALFIPSVGRHTDYGKTRKWAAKLRKIIEKSKYFEENL